MTTHNALTEIHQGGRRSRQSSQDPFSLLQQQLDTHRWQPQFRADLPFQGGALRLFGYELSRRIEQLPQHAVADIALPDMAVGIYDWVLIADHQQQKLTLLSYQDVEQWRALAQAATSNNTATLRPDQRLASQYDTPTVR